MNQSEQYLKILMYSFHWEQLIPISNLLSITFAPSAVVLRYKNTTEGSLQEIGLAFLPIPGYTTFEDAKTLVPFSIAKALSTGVAVLDTDIVVTGWSLTYN